MDFSLSYKSVYTLIEKFHIRKSLRGIKNDCSQHFQAAIEFALDNESYEFLDVMKTNFSLYDEKYAIFYGFGIEYPIVLIKDKDLIIAEFAFLIAKSLTPYDDGLELIKDVYHNNDKIEDIISQYDYLFNRYKEIEDLHLKKIYRNDPCPCGSGDKVKNCHPAFLESDYR